jgi:hypothetical protein
MIQSNELRIGNYYFQFGNILQVNGHIISALEKAPQGQLWCKPIPQTEEWLLKFGFEKTNIKMSGCNVWQKGKYRVLKSYLNDDNTYSLCIDGITPPTWAIAKFEYVHQFQNIYFALEKQELEIKK